MSFLTISIIRAVDNTLKLSNLSWCADLVSVAYYGVRVLCLSSECYHSSAGEDYRGRLAVTVNGNICQMWAKHEQNLSGSGIDPHDPALEENYCRNPGGESKSRPWCYVLDQTTFDVAWEVCDIAPCQGGTPTMTIPLFSIANQDLHTSDDIRDWKLYTSIRMVLVA